MSEDTAYATIKEIDMSEGNRHCDICENDTHCPECNVCMDCVIKRVATLESKLKAVNYDRERAKRAYSVGFADGRYYAEVTYSGDGEEAQVMLVPDEWSWLDTNTPEMKRAKQLAYDRLSRRFAAGWISCEESHPTYQSALMWNPDDGVPVCEAVSADEWPEIIERGGYTLWMDIPALPKQGE